MNRRVWSVIVICVLGLCGGVKVAAQDNVKLAQSGMQFLSIVSDARGAAMGGAATALPMQSASLFFNPETNRVYTSAEVNEDTTVIEGATDVGSECVIGPHSRIVESTIGRGSELKGWNYVSRVSVRNHAVLDLNLRARKSFVIGRCASALFLEVYNVLNSDDLRVYTYEPVPTAGFNISDPTPTEFVIPLLQVSLTALEIVLAKNQARLHGFARGDFAFGKARGEFRDGERVQHEMRQN